MVNLRAVALGVGLLVIWTALALPFPAYVFPDPWEVVLGARLAIVDTELATFDKHIVDTFRRLVIGFAISMTLGTAVGMAMGLRDDVENFLRGWLLAGLSLPGLAIALGLVIIIGLSEAVPILTLVFAATPFITLNVWEGVQAIDTDVVEMSHFFGANRFDLFRSVIMPQMYPYLFASMYWGVIVCWKVLFLAEIFGAGSGVGYMVQYWYTQQVVDRLLGWILIPMIVIVLLLGGITRTRDRVMAWSTA